MAWSRRTITIAAIGAALIAATVAVVVVVVGGSSSHGVSGPTLVRPSSQPFDNGAPCPATTDPSLPGGTGCVTAVTTDLDGNGTSDRFLVFARVDTARRPQSWAARAVVGGRALPDVNVPTGQEVSYVYPRIVAAVDANGDRRAEVFVKLSAILYHGGGQQLLGIYDVQSNRTRPVIVQGQGQLVFHIGGIGGYGDGGLCSGTARNPLLVIRHIQRRAPYEWKWVETTYRWNGATLTLQGVRRGSLPGTVYISDPRIHPFYRLQCGTLLAP